MYLVRIERRAVREFKKIDVSQQSIILEKISSILSLCPFPRGGNPKRLSGTQAFRLRIGDYRVLYTVEGHSVFIYAIRHRKDTYR
ncbi:MAG: type II toxin-antitoxin system RelE/ParE family toxin [Patescibacteria group bacterium]